MKVSRGGGGVNLGGSDPDKHSICKVCSGILKFLKVGGGVRESQTPLLYSVRIHYQEVEYQSITSRKV